MNLEYRGPSHISGCVVASPERGLSIRNLLQPASLIFLAFLVLQASQEYGTAQGAAHNEYPGKNWAQAVKPEDRGWSSVKLAAAKAYAFSIDTAAVVIVDDGIIVSQ